MADINPHKIPQDLVQDLKETHNLDQYPQKPVQANKKLLITIGVALVLLITVWIWKSIEIKNVQGQGKA